MEKKEKTMSSKGISPMSLDENIVSTNHALFTISSPSMTRGIPSIATEKRKVFFIDFGTRNERYMDGITRKKKIESM
jgi:hypothetical protein